MTKEQQKILFTMLDSGRFGNTDKIRLLRNVFSDDGVVSSYERTCDVARQLMSTNQYTLFRNEFRSRIRRNK